MKLDAERHVLNSLHSVHTPAQLTCVAKLCVWQVYPGTVEGANAILSVHV